MRRGACEAVISFTNKLALSIKERGILFMEYLFVWKVLL